MTTQPKALTLRDHELTLELTSMCNLGCWWCSSSATASGKHVSPDALYGHLAENAATCSVVRLSGGEPTLHPSWRDVALRAKELGYRVVLLSNGQARERTACPFVDEYIIHITATGNDEYTARWLRRVGLPVSLHAVLVDNTLGLGLALRMMAEDRFPLRLLALQRQGRGASTVSIPYPLLSWSGSHGCNKAKKVTIAHDGTRATCSALKYGECSLCRGQI